eukprot:gene6832-9354_t
MMMLAKRRSYFRFNPTTRHVIAGKYIFNNVLQLPYHTSFPFQSSNNVKDNDSTISNHKNNLNNGKKEINIEDDGYGYQPKPTLLSAVLSSFQHHPTPGTLILVRHGESEFNQKKLFTGWIDVDLSDRGRREIEHAARLLLERGYTVDITYTSMLKRAIRSSWIILNEINQIYRPVIKSWRLNERMYGALEGLSKPQLANVYGEEIVQRWRSGLYDRPPPMDPSHIHWHKNERHYSNLDPNDIPVTESLQDTIDRTIPLWDSHILPDLKAGRNVMIVAHCNSLRGMVKHIDGIGTLEIQKVGIPNGIPLVYKFDKNMKPMAHKNAAAPLRGIFLEKKGLLRAALERERELAQYIEGYVVETNATSQATTESKPYLNSSNLTQIQSTVTNHDNNTMINNQHMMQEHEPSEAERMTSGTTVNSSAAAVVPNTLLKSLAKLNQQRKLLDLVDNENLASNHHNEERKVVHQSSLNLHRLPVPTSFFEMSLPPSLTYEPLNTPPVTMKPHIHNRNKDDILNRPLLVIIRHGKTEHNQLGLFTGWEDASLAQEGREEAIQAGKVLKKHGVEFDVVYTSWLSRAIETGWMVLNELDLLWVPIVKTWRLNERMYGALTGLSKKMIRQRHGDEQFKKWRRGFDSPPPPISSFSHAYPGNDDRYVNYVQDLDISIFETLIRSLAHGKFELHRTFPKSESLKDCMERTIPYFKNVIVPQSIKPGKNVLIASSENAIRGLLMHLCDIPVDKIHAVEIPTGLPLLYDTVTRSIRILDDGSDKSPLVRYNFGDSPELLFKSKVNGNRIDPEIALKTDYDHFDHILIKYYE